MKKFMLTQTKFQKTSIHTLKIKCLSTLKFATGNNFESHLIHLMFFTH